MPKLTNFAKYAWFIVGYNIFVILWGAWVRITGSGAGCGNHWPTCNGEVIHQPESLETFIELFHRLTSAASGILIIILVVWSFRTFAKKHPARLWAVLSLVFVIIEGLLGAALVRFELVGDNASGARAVMIALHLVNTFILLAVNVLTAWFGSGAPNYSLKQQGTLPWLLLIGLIGTCLIGSSGAITALGDTLFPSTSLLQGIQADLDPTAHFLIRLRVFHPLLAVGFGLYSAILASAYAFFRPNPATRLLSQLLIGVFVVQLVVGVFNVVLLAPGWIQLVHLFLADSFWIVQVLFSAAILAAAPATFGAPATQPAGD